MPYPDLRSFITDLEAHGELIRVRGEVDPVLEIGCFADRLCRLRDGRNKALLFEKVKDSTLPVLMNVFGSESRLCRMAGVADYPGMTRKLSGFLELLQQPRKTLVEKLKALPMLRDVSRCFPTYVKTGPCQQMTYQGEAINLEALPILKTWPLDAGHFVTMPLVFTKDPIDGKRNCGMYRLQRYGKRTLGFHCHTHHTGADHIRKAQSIGRDRLEVAVCIGAEPAVAFSAVVPLPPGLDEMIFAGFLNDSPVKMVKCKTVDLEVPASAEIVLEGYVKVDERRREGPFGDHTGFYSLADSYWVFHCTAVTTRSDPVYHATIVGPPPQEDSHMAKAIERLFLPLMQQPIPEVEDYELPFEGVAHNLMVARIRKSYAGQGRKVAHAVWGLGQAMFTKVIVVTDSTCPSITSGRELVRYAARYLDAAKDIEFVTGPTETLDHASRELHLGSKVSVDLTRPFEAEGKRTAAPIARDQPSDAELLATLQAEVPQVRALHTPFSGEWRHLTLLTLDKRATPDADDLESPEVGVRNTSGLTACRASRAISALWRLFPELPCTQRVVVFDHDEALDDLSRLAWLGLSNIDPQRDVFFDHEVIEEEGMKRLKRHPRRLGVDATTKTAHDGFTRRWPIEQSWPEETLRFVAEHWKGYGMPELSAEERTQLFGRFA